MSKLNNPAGRLHELLVAFDGASNANTTINSVWKRVLEVDDPDLLPALGQAAALLNEVKTAIERSGKQSLKASYDTFSGAWAIPFLSHGRNPGSEGSQDLVDHRALVTLGTVAEVLEYIAPDGAMPESETEAAVRLDLGALLDELVGETELPADLCAVIAARVHDILWAIDHVRIVGPEGVQAAVERLVGQLAIFTHDRPEARTAGLFQRAMQAAARVWGAFRAPGDAVQAIEGWSEALKLLPPG